MKIRLAKKILHRDCDGAAYRFGTLVRARRRYRSWKWKHFSAELPLRGAWASFTFRMLVEQMTMMITQMNAIPAYLLYGLKSVNQVRAANQSPGEKASVWKTGAGEK